MAAIDNCVFPANPRFQLARRIGHGSFGIVFEALDHEWNARIALKICLRSRESSAFLRFKREFRSLADLRHPNLVSLYQLFIEEEASYFTMELLRGKDFGRAFCSPADAVASPATQTAAAPMDLVERAPSASDGPPPLAVRDDAGLLRLARALAQLAEGLGYLHRAGWIHRDIKASNIMVTDDDRVVLVDFGLMDVAERIVAQDPSTGFVAGTPGYIAPEQMLSNRLSPASDWWAVGVVLAEMLTGQSALDDLPRALERIGGERLGVVARTLVQVARSLLDPDPRRRAGRDEILRSLEPLLGSGTPARAVRYRPAPMPFVGRKRERRLLDGALHELRRGQAAWVRVRGAAGLGKSALLAEFTRRVARSDDDVWVLSAICRDRELIPFRGVDALMDQLSVRLRQAPEVASRVGAIEHARTLRALFATLPVDPGTAVRDHDDSLDTRRKAFTAWRAMMDVVAACRTVVLVLDDAHWCDEDSTLLLSTLVERPARILVVVSYRAEAAESPSLSRLDAAMAAHGRRWLDVDLRPLPVQDARELAAGLLAKSEDLNDELRERLVLHAGGHPLLMVALASSLQEPPPATGFKDWPARRLSRLSRGATAVLESVALSPAPVREDVLLLALNGVTGAPQALLDLDVERLLLRHPAEGGSMLEPFHDRVRQAVLRSIPSEVRRLHRLRLARAIQARDGASARPDRASPVTSYSPRSRAACTYLSK